MKTLKTFQDFRNEISIIELALSVGYRIRKKEGIKWPVLKDDVTGDKIIIVNAGSKSNQGYFNPHNGHDKGTLINFVRNRIGSLFPYQSGMSEVRIINAVLYNYQHLPIPEKNMLQSRSRDVVEAYKLKEFHFPGGLTELRDPGYLYFRGIKSEIIGSGLFEGKIFNVKGNDFNNLGFPYYNESGKIIGFELRNRDFKNVVEGSDRSVGIWHSNIPVPVKNVVLTESPIDALSYHQLKGKENSLYISFGGSVAAGQLETCKRIIAKADPDPDLKIFSAVDNDAMGKLYTKKFKDAFPWKVVEDYPRLKDYNEDLIKGQIRRIQLSGM
jgi:hypothetical protein